MSESASDSDAGKCPAHEIRKVPIDGTPLRPSATFGQWREEAAATPLEYEDGHQGLVVTQYELAKLILVDKRFSQKPIRMPLHHTNREESAPGINIVDGELATASELDPGNLLFLDGEQHQKIRRTVTSRFSVRSAKGYESDIKAIVSRQIENLIAQGSPIDLSDHYSEPISAAGHARVLGIPEFLYSDYERFFVRKSEESEKIDYLRRVLAFKKESPGDDVLSDLIKSDLLDNEIEGLTLSLMVSGRDNVAYMISTGILALLRHPDQLKALREDPTLIDGGIEEMLRVSAVFLTMFPRTAMEDVEVGGVKIARGQSVSVSAVAGNYDERKYPDPDRFDLSRDAFGHLGFGHGLHGCLGQQVARIEIKEGIMQLLQAFPNLKLVHAEQEEPMPFYHPVAAYQVGEVIVGWN
jgi:cytochrome P450